MLIEDTLQTPKRSQLLSRTKDYIQLTKLRLSFLVVFSAAAGFLIGSDGSLDWTKFFFLIIGGFLVTGSSNAFNQVIEKDLDRLMTRTEKRPLPDRRLGLNQAIIFSAITGTIGVLVLLYFVNLPSALLGLLALVLYTLAYTPLKRLTPLAVFVGAIPGSFPPMLGWVAATGNFGLVAFLLFAIQFMWQFPHFWAIAWVLDDDYKKAGFRLLPSGNRDRSSAFQTVVYTLALLPLGLTPYFFQMSGIISAIVVSLCGIFFLYLAINLYKTRDVKEARKLMFGSFLYLPLVQMALLFDKIT